MKMFSDLQWESWGNYTEASLYEMIPDDIIDAVAAIDCDIRKYKTVYTVAAIVDFDGGHGYIPDDCDYMVSGYDGDFYKLASLRHNELASEYDFSQMLSNVITNIRDIIKRDGRPSDKSEDEEENKS